MKKNFFSLLIILLIPSFVSATSYSNICGDSGMSYIMTIIGEILNIVKIVIPLIIIVLGMIDFGKATISNDNSAINKATASLTKRFIAGAMVFLIPTIVNVFVTMIINSEIHNELLSCTSCLLNPDECYEEVLLLREEEERLKQEEQENNKEENENSEIINNDVVGAPQIINIEQNGIIIKVNAKKENNEIAKYYFSYTPNKETGGYIETSDQSIDVVRLPGTTYVWVEDTEGKVSAYKTINISSDLIINTDGTILKGTTLNTALTNKGGSVSEFNALIARSVRAGGLYTKEGAATAAVTLVGVLDQEYGVRLPYRGGGKNNYVGISGSWGAKIDDVNYPYRGFDCDGFTHWSYINAGIQIDTSREHNYWYWDRIPFSKEEGEIGDIISQYVPGPHVKIIVGKTAEGFIVAHANGTSVGVWINVHPYTDTENYTIIKGSKIANYYSKNTSYPLGI